MQAGTKKVKLDNTTYGMFHITSCSPCPKLYSLEIIYSSIFPIEMETYLIPFPLNYMTYLIMASNFGARPSFSRKLKRRDCGGQT